MFAVPLCALSTLTLMDGRTCAQPSGSLQPKVMVTGHRPGHRLPLDPSVCNPSLELWACCDPDLSRPVQTHPPAGRCPREADPTGGTGTGAAGWSGLPVPAGLLQPEAAGPTSKARAWTQSSSLGAQDRVQASWAFAITGHTPGLGPRWSHRGDPRTAGWGAGPAAAPPSAPGPRPHLGLERFWPASQTPVGGFTPPGGPGRPSSCGSEIRGTADPHPGRSEAGEQDCGWTAWPRRPQAGRLPWGGDMLPSRRPSWSRLLSGWHRVAGLSPCVYGGVHVSGRAPVCRVEKQGCCRVSPAS